MLQYDYQLINPPSNSGSVWVFSVDIPQGGGTLQLESGGLPVYPAFLADFASNNQSPARAITRAVAATAQAPNGWMASISSDGKAIWSSGKVDLAPGQTLSGYQVFSRGLPTIRSFSAQPYLDVALLTVAPPNGDPADTARYKADLDAAENSTGTQGFTIGPEGLPSPFVPKAFLSTIQGYELKAASLGWISSPTTTSALATRLADAQSALGKNDIPATTASLQALLNDATAAQSAKTISSETWALLTYNVQYLMANLQSPPSAPPAISAGSVVPVNSRVNTIQPGEWVSIYGSNLTSDTVTWKGDFPTSLGGTNVKINGKSAYVSFVSPGQINLQAPDDTATGTVPLTVTNARGTATSSVTLAQFGPSFCLLDATHVAGIILRSDGSGAYGGGTYDILGPSGMSLGYQAVAAKAGDKVELFGTGFGPTKPAVPSGQPFSGAASAINAVSVRINNVSLAPTFAGLSGAGLFQLNITIPPDLGTGDFALQARVGGVLTPSGVVISLR